MPDKRLLFLHTGGTLGMTRRRDPGPLEPSAYAEDLLPYVRGLEDIAHIEGRVVANVDSSDMTPALWEALATQIAAELDHFDGFVVLHGTDTMAFTAAALSYMLHGLTKPVVLTGSQRPIAEVRTDARANLVHSAICATMDLPEVGLYFGDHLFRGNRTTKVSIQSYDAFSSPNFPPLLEMGVDVVPRAAPLRPSGPFCLRPGFSTDIAVLSAVPGVGAGLVDRVVDGGVRALVIRAFGDGNLPQAGWPDAIRRATARGVTVILASQCRAGAVQPGRYRNSAVARDAGALFSGDMTGEAAVVKAMWLLGQGCDDAAMRARFSQPLAGEVRPGSDDQPRMS